MADEALIRQLVFHEGIRLKPYRDTVGKLTIGVGRNLDDVGISGEEARHLLANDIARTEAAMIQALPWVTTLDPIRYRVLLDMAFNMGVGGLLGFKKMLAAASVADWPQTVLEMFDSKCATQVGQRAHTLAKMIRTGEDPFQD